MDGRRSRPVRNTLQLTNAPSEYVQNKKILRKFEPFFVEHFCIDCEKTRKLNPPTRTILGIIPILPEPSTSTGSIKQVKQLNRQSFFLAKHKLSLYSWHEIGNTQISEVQYQE